MFEQMVFPSCITIPNASLRWSQLERLETGFLFQRMNFFASFLLIKNSPPVEGNYFVEGGAPSLHLGGIIPLSDLLLFLTKIKSGLTISGYSCINHLGV